MTTPVNKHGVCISRKLKKAKTQPLDGDTSSSSQEVPIPIKNTFIDYPLCVTPETAQHMKVRHSKSGNGLPSTPTTPVSKPGTSGSGTVSRALRKAATQPLSGTSSTSREEIPIPIKNTFIEYPSILSPETAQHMKVRHNKSGPADMDPIPDRLRLSREKSSSRGKQVEAPQEKAEPPVRGGGKPQQPAAAPAPARSAISGLATPSRSRAESGQPRVISLSEALRPPALPGSPELPSLGSKGHGTGNCKPCAFNHRRGCESGARCEFCHLCDAGERKRRQKERHRQHHQQQSMAAGTCRGLSPALSPTAMGGQQPCPAGWRA